MATLFPHLTPITTPVRQPDDRLMEIAFKLGPLTFAEQAYLSAREAEDVPSDAMDAAKWGDL